MGIWCKEAVRVNHEIKAYVEYQDDWTGAITCYIRKIYTDGDRAYCRVLGSRVDMTEQKRDLLNREQQVAIWHAWFQKTKY